MRPEHCYWTKFDPSAQFKKYFRRVEDLFAGKWFVQEINPSENNSYQWYQLSWEVFPAFYELLTMEVFEFNL